MSHRTANSTIAADARILAARLAALMPYRPTPEHRVTYSRQTALSYLQTAADWLDRDTDDMGAEAAPLRRRLLSFQCATCGRTVITASPEDRFCDNCRPRDPDAAEETPAPLPLP